MKWIDNSNSNSQFDSNSLFKFWQFYSLIYFYLLLYLYLYIFNFFLGVNSLSANPIKWSNTLKQFVNCFRGIIWVCLTFLWCWRLKGSLIMMLFCLVLFIKPNWNKLIMIIIFFFLYNNNRNKSRKCRVVVQRGLFLCLLEKGASKTLLGSPSRQNVSIKVSLGGNSNPILSLWMTYNCIYI